MCKIFVFLCPFWNLYLRSEVNQLKVKCSNSEEGCEWTGELGQLNIHLESESGCDFEVVECPNKCMQYTTIIRKDLERHQNSECPLRPYHCEYCSLKGSYAGITGIPPGMVLSKPHYDECPAYPLTCPNKCGVDGIRRRDMADHRSKCPQEPVECPFAEAGCKETVHRQELANHISSSMQQHLLLVMGTCKQLKSELQETKAKLAVNEATVITAVQLLREGKKADKETIDSIIICPGYLKSEGAILTVAMPRVSEYHRNGKIWLSAPFYLKEGYKMCLEVSVEEMETGICTGISISICLLKGEHDDKLKWPIGNKECRPVPPPPSLPSSSPEIPFTKDAWFHMCPLRQLQQADMKLWCPKRTCFHLVNDCLEFTVEYFIIYNAMSNTNSCDHLKLKVECRHV